MEAKWIIGPYLTEKNRFVREIVRTSSTDREEQRLIDDATDATWQFCCPVIIEKLS